MSSLIGTELLKLRLTRGTWGFVAAAVVLAAVRMIMVMLSAGTAAGVDRGTTTATLTMVGAVGLAAMVLLLLGATVVTGEFRHATITATLLTTPHRRSVVTAKLAASAIAGAVLSTGLLIGALAVAAASGLAGPLRTTVLHAAVATVAAGMLLALLGVAIGLLVRNQTVALVAPLVWLVVIEPLTRSFGLTVLTPWLPGSLLADLGPGAPAGSPPPLMAAAILALYVAALTMLGARRLQRADIA
jgi:ABC-2 type transport system permease protein